MSDKPNPNRARYLETLRRMTPEQRLAKAFELTEMGRQLLRDGIAHSFPHLTDEQRHQLYLERLAQCHNRNY